MDVYHKVLSRIHKESGGKETVRVDIGELLKQEGFFPSLEQIRSHMVKEGWITESDRKDHVQITHWGVAEAKKTARGGTDTSRELEKDSKSLVTGAKEIVVMCEEFEGSPEKKKLDLIVKRLDDLKGLIERLRSNVS
jgi:hypothetical protein